MPDDQDPKIQDAWDAPGCDDSSRPLDGEQDVPEPDPRPLERLWDDDAGYEPQPEDAFAPDPEPRELANADIVGSVYIAIHPRLPEMVKIGRSNDVAKRMRQLSTGLPEDFDATAALATPFPVEAERVCHQAMHDYRVLPDRELFAVSAVPVVEEFECPDTGAVYTETRLPFLELGEYLSQELDRHGIPHWYVPGSAYPSRVLRRLR